MNIFLTIILPIIIFVVLAGLFGFFLTYLGEKMVPLRDPKIDDISVLLAGINCGACGCAGCDQFAEKLVSGEAQLNACNPTSQENKKKINRVLGMTQGESMARVAVVRCNGGHKCKNKYSYQGFGDCQSAEVLSGGNKACYTGCMGLGSCVDYCTFDAVKVNRDTGVAYIDSDLCTSCGACITACPLKLIGRIRVNAKIYVACNNTQDGKSVKAVCENGCIGCKICEKTCKYGGIKVENNLAVVKYNDCVGCMECVSKCPTGCIKPFEQPASFIKEQETVAMQDL